MLRGAIPIEIELQRYLIRSSVLIRLHYLDYFPVSLRMNDAAGPNVKLVQKNDALWKSFPEDINPIIGTAPTEQRVTTF